MKGRSIQQIALKTFLIVWAFFALTLAGRAQSYFSASLLSRWQGEFGGAVQRIAVQDQYVFTTVADGGLIIYDTTNPDEPRKLGSIDLAGSALDVAVEGNFAYVAAGGTNGLQIVDVSDKANPRLAGRLDSLIDANRVFAKNGVVFVAAQGGCFGVDVSNPAEPFAWATVSLRATLGFCLSGDSLFISHPTGISVVDIASASVLSTQFFEGMASILQPGGSAVYLLNSYTKTIDAYDFADRLAPRWLGRYAPTTAPRDLVIVGNNAYVFQDKKIEVFDLSEPNRLTPYAEAPWDHKHQTFSVVGNRLYATGQSGVEIFDFADPMRPARLGQFDPAVSGFDIAVAGHTAFLASGGGGLQILDVTNPLGVTRFGGIRTHGNAQGVVVRGGIAYVAAGLAGLEILDVSNPRQPALLGRCDTPGDARRIAIAGTIAYVADEAGGLQIINVSDPARPARLSSFLPPRPVHSVAVKDNFVYIGSRRLDVLDVTDPANPKPASVLDTGAEIKWIGLRDDRAFVGGSYTVDISNPRAVRTRFTGSQIAEGGSFFDDYLHLADHRGLLVFDTSITLGPITVRSPKDQAARGVAVANDLVYMAGNEGAVSIYRTTLHPHVRIDNKLAVNGGPARVAVRWNAFHSRFALFTSADMNSPSSQWTEVKPEKLQAVRDGEELEFQQTLEAGARFFQLRRVAP